MQRIRASRAVVWSAVAVGLLIVVTAAPARAAHSMEGEAEIGESPPGVKIERRVMGPSPSSFDKGNVVIIGFWDPDHLDELPTAEVECLEELSRLHAEYHDRLHILIFISEIPHKIKTFKEDVGKETVNFTIVEDDQKWTRRTWCGMRESIAQGGRRHLLFLIGRDGRIATRISMHGSQDAGKLEEEIRRELGPLADAVRLEPGRKAPPLPGKTIQGDPVDPSGGAPCVVQWASASSADWRTEEDASTFVHLHKTYGDRIRFLGVMADDEEKIREAIERREIRYPVLQASKPVEDAWSFLRERPCTFLVHKGKVVHAGLGEEGLETALMAFVAEHRPGRRKRPKPSTGDRGAGKAPEESADADPDEADDAGRDAGEEVAPEEDDAERRRRMREKAKSLLGG